MGVLNLDVQMVLDYTTCCECGVHIIMDAEHMKQLRRDHSWFYCLNGHNQHFTGKTDADRLRDVEQELERERLRRQTAAAERDHQERRVRAYKGKLTTIKKRVAHGVCPCCKRTFKNLANHMQEKHPNYGESDS